MNENNPFSILNDGGLMAILKEYKKAENQHSSAGFNIFTIISDKYHHENLHSDVIKAFLDPKEQHQKGNLFLCKFIEMLNKKRDSQGLKNLEIYKEPTVERERHHIDILIKNEDTKSCIIIENKLNGAQDMPKQLSRYYEEMTGQNYQVDAIVYLTRTEIERPDRQSFQEIKEEDQKKILVIPATSRCSKDVTLIKDWIEPCIAKNYNSDSTAILQQYSRLLQLLFQPSKTHDSMCKLYNYLNTGNNLEKLDDIKSLSRMLNELPETMAQQLSEDLEKCVYNKNLTKVGCIWPKDPDHSVIQLEDNFCIYIICHADADSAYELNVVNWNHNIREIKNLVFSELRMRSDDSRGKGRYFKSYAWKEKNQLLEDIDTILPKLTSLIQNSYRTDKA